MTNLGENKKELEADLKELEEKGGVPTEIGRKAVEKAKVEKPVKESRKVAKKANKKIQKKEKKNQKKEREHKANHEAIKKDLKKLSLNEVAKKYGISYSLAWVIKTDYRHTQNK